MFLHDMKIRPQPDFDRLARVLRRQGLPDRIPFYELKSDIESAVMRSIGETDGVVSPAFHDPSYEDWVLRQHVSYMHRLGYDYVSVRARGFAFPEKERATGMTDHGERMYVRAETSTISNREDFERYPWPDMARVDYSPLEKVEKLLPDGMKVVTRFSGVLENVMWLLGYERISYLLYEDEQLVDDMFEAVATRIITYLDTHACFDVVGAIQLGDDMGFKTQTMLSPQTYRKYLFPWHKKLVETVHRRGKPIILHSCGNLKEVTEDIIDCGWDAKHSFEDEIEPVWEFKEKYGDRIAVLGGFDMDKICRMSEEEVRKHTRFLIKKCAPGGGWALGTGNSVANYVPVENFLAMLEEGYGAAVY